MNAQRLRRILEMLTVLESEYQVQQRLEQLRQGLEQLQNSPGDINAQQMVSTRIDTLDASLLALEDQLELYQRKLVSEIGAEQFFSSDLVRRIRVEIAENAMTPAVVHQRVAQMRDARAAFLQQMSQAVGGLAAMGIESEDLAPGEAELDVLIPRDLFHNKLDELSKELSVLNQIINTFSEVRTGRTETIEVGEISTTDPVFSLTFNPATMAMIAGAITWLLNTWKQSLEIKKLRAETAKSPVFDEQDLKMFDDKIEAHVEQRINEKVAELLGDSAATPGRAQELEGWLKWSMRELLGRIERGMVIDVRLLPPPETSSAGDEPTPSSPEQEAFRQLDTFSSQLSYPPTEGDPILKIGRARPAKGKE